MNKITPFLWFDNNAEEAVKFYTKIFSKSKISRTVKYDEAGAKASGRKIGSVMTVDFSLEGQNFVAINGGPIFKINPSISFFIHCKTAKEVDGFYNKLSKDGTIMMALDKYPFSERYAFIADKFGVSWQIILSPSKQKIVPSLLFVGDKMGNAEEAIKLYTKIFKNSKVNALEMYKSGAPKGSVMYSSFTLDGEYFSLMSGPGNHQFDFNEAISFVVNCKDQKEIDYYWNNLTRNGGQEVQCGWLKDKFGVSWQIVPIEMPKLVSGKNSKKVMEAMFKMKKLDIAILKQSAKS